MKRNCKTRKIYEEYYGVKLPKNYEVHHKIPVHEGGTDDPANLVALTKEEHRNEHLKIYKKTNNFRDLCAYHMIGYNFSEAHKISSSEGGKKGGNKVKKLGIGICCADKNKRAKWASLGGKIGGKVQKEKKIGIHGQTKQQRLLACSKGGKVGAFTKSEIQSRLGKRGGIKNKGFIWLNDGKKSIKYTKREQELKPIDDFIKEHTNLKLGKIQIKKRCNVCGKEMSAMAIGKYHNSRCKNGKNKIN